MSCKQSSGGTMRIKKSKHEREMHHSNLYVLMHTRFAIAIIFRYECVSENYHNIITNSKLGQMDRHQRNLYLYPIISNNERKMTDIHCIVLYLILSSVVMMSFMYSFILEKESGIFKPEDPSGRKCGEGEAQKYPYIYFPSPFPESAVRAVCVEKCPINRYSQISCLPNILVSKCSYNMTEHFDRSAQFLIYPTKPNSFLNMCQPLSHILFDSLNSIINTHSLISNIEDVYEARYIIFILSPVICVLLTSIYLLLINLLENIRYLLAGVYLMFLVSLATFTIYLFLPQTTRSFTYSKVVGLATALILLAIIIYTIYERNYFLRSLTLLNIGSIYIRQNKSLIIMPILMSLISAISFLIWIAVMIFLYSIDSSEEGVEDYKFAYLFNIRHSQFVVFLLFLATLHLLWTILIIQHFGKYVARVGAANWIMNVPRNLKNALYVLVRFHIGSVIEGSVFIFLFGWITNICYFFMPDRRDRIFCFTSPRLSEMYHGECFRRFLGYWSDLTYIYTGFNGDNFLSSGYKITPIIAVNLHHISRGYSLARWIVDVSRLLIAMLTTLLCLVVISLMKDLYNQLIIVFIIFILSLFLSSFCFDLYDKAFETIIIAISMNRSVERGEEYSQLDDKQESNKGRDRVYNKIECWLREERQYEQQQSRGQQPHQ